MAAPIEGNKVLIDESTKGVTYVGIAPYRKGSMIDDRKTYFSEDDTELEIWQIRKIETRDSITEISYPNGDTGNNYSWEARESLTYK